MELLDLTGQTFGMWNVLGRSVNNGKDAMWRCQCECGTVKDVYRGSLRGGVSKGCSKCRKSRYDHPRKPPGETGRTAYLTAYKKSARTRALAWLLTDADVFALAAQGCHYCGAPPTGQYRPANAGSEESTRLGIFLNNGIDRVDNGLGYTKDNCVPCCKPCNYAKSNWPYDEFLAWIERVHVHQIAKRFAVAAAA